MRRIMRRFCGVFLCLAPVMAALGDEPQQDYNNVVPRLVFYLPFDGTLTALTQEGEVNPVTGGTATNQVEFVPGVCGQGVRLGAPLNNPAVWFNDVILYPAKWLKTMEQGTIALWYKNPRWVEQPWQVPALLTTAQPDRAKTSAFQTPLSWWIYDRLTAPPEQAASKWRHWEITTKNDIEHPRNIRPRAKDDDIWHFWALRWNRKHRLLEVYDDGILRDIGQYDSCLQPGQPFWRESYLGKTTDVYETVDKIDFNDIFLGQIELARFCRVTLDEICVLDQPLSLAAIQQAVQRGLKGNPMWYEGVSLSKEAAQPGARKPGPAARGAFLQKRDRVAICGDSIAFDKKYSLILGTYLLACHPQLELQVIQNAVDGEDTSGFLNRMRATALDLWHPTAATLGYGMNDGHYTAYSDFIGYYYKQNLERIVEEFQKNAVRVMIGSAGIVAENNGPNVYNETLRRLSKIAEQLATDRGCWFADVHNSMRLARDKMRALHGASYDLIGGDGVHADRQGQMAMALGFLKAFGLDGKLGEIAFDSDTLQATAQAGHSISNVVGTSIAVVSRRFPYAFAEAASGSLADMRKVAEELGFFEQCDVFNFILKGKTSGKYRLKWDVAASGTNQWAGGWTAQFDAAELAKGVNLAKAFHINPFSEKIAKIAGLLAFKYKIEYAVQTGTLDSQRLSLAKSLKLDQDSAQLEQMIEDPQRLHKLLEFQLRNEIDTPVCHRLTVTRLDGK